MTLSVFMYSKKKVLWFGLRCVRKPTFYICKNKGTDHLRDDSAPNASVICIPGPGDTGDIAGLKCRNLTSDVSRQCRGCAGVLISR